MLICWNTTCVDCSFPEPQFKRFEKKNFRNRVQSSKVLPLEFDCWDLNLITWRAYARPALEKWYLVKISDRGLVAANIQGTRHNGGGQRMVNQLLTGDRRGSTWCSLTSNQLSNIHLDISRRNLLSCYVMFNRLEGYCDMIMTRRGQIGWRRFKSFSELGWQSLASSSSPAW